MENASTLCGRRGALVRAEKLKFRAHDLRHKFAIAWLKNGGGIYELSRHLGQDDRDLSRLCRHKSRHSNDGFAAANRDRKCQLTY